ncbi:Trk system potassium transporter TrkA [Miniphocaeibacter massiliensis]|uniref:Trk system potassium transporter TrkA n=1 Tax=Miniphocaeibacter massiliensis TaxID=2041841 RepID=UPI000C07A791|nr:Trk system potassium transporter TrkA [Miniphocaeibacter massiliensis]
MNIIIVGAGKVGEYLCQDLASEGYDITLIEKDKEILNRILDYNDIIGIQGDGADTFVLEEAGIDRCDIFIAVTNQDELNMVSCVMAKKLGANYTISRVRNPEYSKHVDFMSETMDINLMINPELETAREIVRILSYPNVLNVDTFDHGKINIVSFRLKENSVLNDMSLNEIQNKINRNILVCSVLRGEEVFIPNGDFILKANDIIYIIGENDALNEFFRFIGTKSKIKNVIVVGGGRISYYLIERLIKQHVHVKVIEKRKSIAEFLSFNFPEADVIKQDGTNHDVLEEERIDFFDAFIALTGIDEENIIASIFAHKKGLERTVTKVDRTRILDMVELKEIGTTISPKKVISDKIVQFVRTHSKVENAKIESLYRIADDKVEAIEVLIDKDSEILNIRLKDLDIRENTLLSFILRGNKLIIPNGDDSIQIDDKVFIITTNKSFKEIEDILNK